MGCPIHRRTGDPAECSAIRLGQSSFQHQLQRADAGRGRHRDVGGRCAKGDGVRCREQPQGRSARWWAFLCGGVHGERHDGARSAAAARRHRLRRRYRSGHGDARDESVCDAPGSGGGGPGYPDGNLPVGRRGGPRPGRRAGRPFPARRADVGRIAVGHGGAAWRPDGHRVRQLPARPVLGVARRRWRKLRRDHVADLRDVSHRRGRRGESQLPAAVVRPGAGGLAELAAYRRSKLLGAGGCHCRPNGHALSHPGDLPGRVGCRRGIGHHLCRRHPAERHGKSHVQLLGL